MPKLQKILKQNNLPTISNGFSIYALYLTIFFICWTITNVDYPNLGLTAESLQWHYAKPTLIASLVVALVISYRGWWKVSLFDSKKSGPKWAWIGPVVMILLITGGLLRINTDSLSLELIVWAILGAIGVGFGEEIITRGTLLAGLRSKYNETKVWFISTIAFSALHAPNIFFGLELSSMIIQFIFAFIVGSLFYATRRISGSLLLPMILHGLWDSSIFLQRATSAEAWALQLLIYPTAIVCVVAVILRNRKLKIHSSQLTS